MLVRWRSREPNLERNQGCCEMTAVAESRLWTVALLLIFVSLCTPHGAMSAEAKRVLLLHSFGRDVSPYDATEAAIRAELMRRSNEPLAIFDVSLDAGHASGRDDQQPVAELLRHRFADAPPDVVVTIAPPAAAFYLHNRDYVFPGKPVVVAALDA